MTTEHPGRHHYASCGEWRPVSPDHDCPTCPNKCPGCSAYYARRGAPVATVAPATLTDPVRAAVRPVSYGTATTDPLGRGEPNSRTRIPRRVDT